MATFVWLALLLGLAQVQPVPSNAPPSVIEVIRFGWRSQLQNGSGLETGMTGAGGTGPQRPDQVNREMEIQRQQAAGNKQILDELDQKAKRDQLPTLVKGKQTAEKHTYQYVLEIKNTSAKQVIEIAWDYVFIDPKTSEELLRRSFISKVKIKPEKKATVIMVSAASPYQVIDAKGKMNKNGEQIVFKRILYADKSEWEN